MASIELTLSNLLLVGFLGLVLTKLVKYFQQWRVERMMHKWDNSPKDKVILHSMWRCKTIPSLSIFGLKLETYLRLAKIPYELDDKDPYGPKGKVPWMSFNGVHLGDSHLIIQYLNKKLGINLNKGRSAEEIAKARACRILLEEHFFFGLMHFRWIENLSKLPQLSKFPAIFKLLTPLIAWQIGKRLVAQGIGLHKRFEIYEMSEDDLRTVSGILGAKKFLGGDEPCEDDCAVFGAVAQVVWAMPNSSFQSLVNGELINLKEYCERMKEKLWPDWEDCIDHS